MHLKYNYFKWNCFDCIETEYRQEDNLKKDYSSLGISFLLYMKNSYVSKITRLNEKRGIYALKDALCACFKLSEFMN